LTRSASRTRVVKRLCWHLHEIDPSWAPPARCRWRPEHLGTILERLGDMNAQSLGWHGARQRCLQLSVEITELDEDVTALVRPIAPSLLELWLRHADGGRDRR
jgi:hypothetical protein